MKKRTVSKIGKLACLLLLPLAAMNVAGAAVVGRSVWNDKWLLVIPASSLNADRTRALETFINGVGDIKIGFRAYSRSGN